MKLKTRFYFLLMALSFVAGCGGNSGDASSGDFTDIPYDVGESATLSQVTQDISGLSGVTFSIAPELQAKLAETPVDLPTLLGLNIGQVLVLLQDTMPEGLSYIFVQTAAGSVELRSRFQQSENLAAAAPITILEFNAPGVSLATLVSEAETEEEECGGDDVLGLLGSGGIFDIVTEIQADPGNHAPSIGDLPPSIDLAIEGNELTVTGAAPWVAVSGPIQNDGSFTCSGAGLVAGFNDVQVEFIGQASPDGVFGTLSMGVGGELPGGDAAVFAIGAP